MAVAAKSGKRMHDDFVVKPGDIATCEGEDYVVVSQTTYRGPRAAWVEWMLRRGSGNAWLILVRADRQLLVGHVRSPEGVPGDEVLEVGGQCLRMVSSGKADVETVTDAGATGFDRVEFWQYADEAQGRLFVTRSHGGHRALLLEPIDPIGFEVYSA